MHTFYELYECLCKVRPLHLYTIIAEYDKIILYIRFRGICFSVRIPPFIFCKFQRSKKKQSKFKKEKHEFRCTNSSFYHSLDEALFDEKLIVKMTNLLDVLYFLRICRLYIQKQYSNSASHIGGLFCLSFSIYYRV